MSNHLTFFVPYQQSDPDFTGNLRPLYWCIHYSCLATPTFSVKTLLDCSSFTQLLTSILQLKQRHVLLLQTVMHMLSFKFATRPWKSKLFQFKNPHSYPKDWAHNHVKVNIRKTNENTW